MNRRKIFKKNKMNKIITYDQFVNEEILVNSDVHRDLKFNPNKKITLKDNWGNKKVYVGYWSTEDNDWYGLPEPNWIGWKDEKLYNEFVEKLKNKFRKSSRWIGNPVKEIYYKGFSNCRVCNKKNGSIEYEIIEDNFVYLVPEGYLHYIIKHKIRPHNWFLKYILTT